MKIKSPHLYIRIGTFLLILFLFSFSLFSQTPGSNSSALSREDRYAKFESVMLYPLIKGSKMTGVIPIENISNKPDPNKEIKLIFDFIQETANNAQGTHVNEGLEEVARTMNLHIAAGVKKEKLKTTIIFHSGSIFTVLNNSYYQSIYGSPNPNTDILMQLLDAGTELVICGQSMQLRGARQEELLPQVKVALSAKTILSSYQNNGYINFLINL